MTKKFLQDRRGNVLPIFALAIVPVFGFVGAAVDYSRMSSVRTSMQNAIDATALSMSKDAGTLSAEQITEKGTAHFNALFTHPEARNIVVTSALVANEGIYTLKMTATAKVDATLARVLGQTEASIGATTEVVWGIKRLELALALDNTGSMSSSSKMTELKKAAKTLINTLYKAAKKPGDVKIAIVPFATAVNIGTGNKTASWLDWTDWENKNGTCSKSWYSSKSSCTWNGGTWTAASRDDWNGCVWDRDQSYDVNDTTPTSTATSFQPNQASNCPVPMLELTDVYTGNAWVEADLTASTPTSVLGQKINAMAPTGNTNVTIGMAWGWHAISKSEPLSTASEPKQDLDKVVILLTDGDNTQNRWSTNQTNIDARTTLACSNAKAAGIKIYTVRVINGNANLLRGCATNTAMYYDVQNAAQLNAVFTSIAQNLANLRLAK